MSINFRTKIPTEFKTQYKDCSQCQSKHGIKRQVSAKEVRWICDTCWNRYALRSAKEKPHFIKASRLYHG